MHGRDADCPDVVTDPEGVMTCGIGSAMHRMAFVYNPYLYRFPCGAGVNFSSKFTRGAVMADFDEVEYERDYPREIIAIKTEIMLDEQWFDCVIANISPSGAKLYVGRNVSRGKDVIIKIGEFGEFDATVAWCHADEIGVKFDHDPLDMTNVLIGLASQG